MRQVPSCLKCESYSAIYPGGVNGKTLDIYGFLRVGGAWPMPDMPMGSSLLTSLVSTTDRH